MLPPSVCILLELCEFGSLADVLKGISTTALYYTSGVRSSRTTAPSSYSSGSGFPVLGNSFHLHFPSQLSKKKSSKSRNASNRDGSAAGRHAVMQLSWVDRLYLAVGCCRGLAALHAYSTDLCHRDIKSFNFLGLHILSFRYLLNASF